MCGKKPRREEISVERDRKWQGSRPGVMAGSLSSESKTSSREKRGEGKASQRPDLKLLPFHG